MEYSVPANAFSAWERRSGSAVAHSRALPGTVFADDPAPDRIALAGKGLLPHTRVPGRAGDHHHQLEFGIDEDRLTVDTEQRESPLLAREEPELVAIAEIGRRLRRGERFGLTMPVGGIEQIVLWHDLLAAGRAVIGEQDSKTAIVAQDRIEISRPGFGAVFGFHPCRVTFGTHWLPEPRGEIFAE